ncbi:helix-turn-helix domain-containing protein [Bradyrhizobium sp. WSM 1704]|uniref:AraC-like ligand-binding domain-containing protein n=1 Tax=Bradyrhizobium semiaridum TaxID=2821404 RepID=UPI001CE302A6|nr:helix-turn-helix domain-containing protein [Bradyrhizobium semiaridum]MCA6122689.1 helix-turn-helix domain-containing protein [Bradyrhizobium semiaridum]
MPALFTTEDAPTHRRLALWQDIVCDVFVQLDCRSDLGTAFHGAITSAQLGAARCSTVSSSRQRVLRTPSRIARASEDFILIALGRRGTGSVLQDGRETVIQAGEFAFYDTTRPYELRFNDDFTQTIFQMPREMLHRRFAGTQALTATTFTSDSPVQRLACQFIAGLAEVADRLDPDNAIRLSDQAADLLAMAMAERLGSAALPASTHRSALLYRLKAHVLAHLQNPDLGLTETAAALGISPRYASSLFADEGTSFQRFLLAQRLERCRRDLASPAHAHRHIGEIAFAWGFNDLSHFGRVFREHYGQSPRDWRHSRLPN